MNKWLLLTPIALWLSVDILVLLTLLMDAYGWMQVFNLIALLLLKPLAWIFTIRAIWVYFTKYAD